MNRHVVVLGLCALTLCACGSAGRASSGPTTRPSQPSFSTTSTTRERQPIVLSLELPSGTMKAGGTMRGAVLIDNNTGAPVDGGCLVFAVALGNDG